MCLLIHPPADVQPGCSRVSAPVNKAAVNTGDSYRFEVVFSSPLDVLRGAGFLGHVVGSSVLEVLAPALVSALVSVLAEPCGLSVLRSQELPHAVFHLTRSLCSCV